MTNYEHIKVLSLEEMAKGMINFCPTELSSVLYTGISGKYTETAEETIENNKKWLQQEVG